MISVRRVPYRGDVWRLKPGAGPDEGAAAFRDRRCYCIVLSADDFNAANLGLIVGVPITEVDRGIPLHIPLRIPLFESPRFAKCEELRCIPDLALDEWCGRIEESLMQQIADRIRVVLDL